MQRQARQRPSLRVCKGTQGINQGPPYRCDCSAFTRAIGVDGEQETATGVACHDNTPGSVDPIGNAEGTDQDCSDRAGRDPDGQAPIQVPACDAGSFRNLICRCRIFTRMHRAIERRR
jgi:hypothetical protein